MHAVSGTLFYHIPKVIFFITYPIYLNFTFKAPARSWTVKISMGIRDEQQRTASKENISEILNPKVLHFSGTYYKHFMNVNFSVLLKMFVA